MKSNPSLLEYADKSFFNVRLLAAKGQLITTLIVFSFFGDLR